MSKVAHYLQEHLSGEVISSSDARRYFATDGSILQLAPSLVVYPRNENDIRKTARFSWQLAERGRAIPLIPRGAGSDKTGAAIGSGMILSFTAYMNNILELNSKSGDVIVEPGISLGKLQQTLNTHGRFLPSVPPSYEYETVGGSLGNNASGDKSLKYGSMLNYAKSLRVVLSNGEVIVTKRLSKRELSKKLGLSTFEGEIYRYVDATLEEHHDLVKHLERGTTKNNAGYNLLDVENKDGSFDLTPLIVGSQGTLGIITEAILSSEPFDPKTTLIMAGFDSIEHLQKAIEELRKLSELPNSIEFLDQYALNQISALNPNHLKGIIPHPTPAFLVLIEMNSANKKSLKKADKILSEYAVNHESSEDLEEQQKYIQVRHAINILNAHNEGLIHPVPLFDGAVPPERLREYLEGIYKMLSNSSTKPALWGHLGDANIFFQPKLNLGQVGDRQKVFRLIDEHTKLVLSLGGTISASAGDGRLKTPYLEMMYGSELYTLFKKLKNIFDPYSILNPGVKFGTGAEELKAIIRSDFSLNHLYNNIPRS